MSGSRTGFRSMLAALVKRRGWRVFEGGCAHTREDCACRSCRRAGGLVPKAHQAAQVECPGLVHFEAVASGTYSWHIRTRCDACGQSLSEAS